MNFNQTNTPLGNHQWVNLVNAPPFDGQVEYSVMLPRKIGSKGVNSPPELESDDVPQQFTRFAFRA